MANQFDERLRQSSVLQRTLCQDSFISWGNEIEGFVLLFMPEIYKIIALNKQDFYLIYNSDHKGKKKYRKKYLAEILLKILLLLLI